MTVLATKTRAKEASGLALTFLRLLQIFLLIALGWVLIRAILLFTNPESIWTALPNVSPVAANGSSTAERLYDFSTDPFRLPPSDGTGPAVVAEGFDAPETTLKIVLLGRFAGGAQIATLKTPDNREKSYSVGDEVMNGVTLQNVYSDFVVLNVNGEVQRLTFQRDSRTGLSNVETDTASQSVSVGDTSAQATDTDTISTIPGQNADLSKLIQLVQINPNFDQGQFAGFSIKGRNDDAVLKQFGLQSGDVITAVNGDSLLEGAPDLQGLVRKFSNATQVQLDIIRDGRPVTVQIGS
ncbi:type II secretion system protein N [Litorimonas haliclonae]|uniref:type II secretion system protein N n=1 Tax=Litorimonas haliclonae TaxID=2081977 RepID=UPI0039EE5AA7